MRKALSLMVSGYTCVSRQLASWLQQDVGIRKPVTQIYNGVDTATFRPAGLSAVDIATLLEIPSNSSYFSQIKRATGVKREKHRGRFIYFSEAPINYQQQKRAMDYQQ